VRLKSQLFVIAVVWCSVSTATVTHLRAAPAGNSPAGASSAAVEDHRCDAAPVVSPGELRHRRSRLVTGLGSPRHRAIDVVASPGADRHVLRGSLSYGKAHKDLEDEDVELFACDRGAWHAIGTARTDDDGDFSLALAGARRLAPGMRDLYASAVGDRTGVRFLAYVAPAATRVIVSDVDGTLTASEHAFVRTVVANSRIGAQPGAAAAFRELAASGYQPVYVTARGEVFTEKTRAWLAQQGFPRGPMILAEDLVTVPGPATVAFKTGAMDALTSAGLVVAGGIGNRATDIAAYEAMGLPADRIFIGTQEFAEELAPALSRGRATAFARYDALAAGHLTRLPR
jgi:phosphatidate phosphatase PAH1